MTFRTKRCVVGSHLPIALGSEVQKGEHSAASGLLPQKCPFQKSSVIQAGLGATGAEIPLECLSNAFCAHMATMVSFLPRMQSSNHIPHRGVFPQLPVEKLPVRKL